MSSGERRSQEAIQRNRAASRERMRKLRAKNPEAARLRSHDQQVKRSNLDGRPFIGWDGEGHNIYVASSDGTIDVTHHYMLFGASTGDYVTDTSLSTEACLALILDVERANPDVFHVGFSFEYDVNMILADLTWRKLNLLKSVNKVHWKGYYIEHIPHKWLRVSKDGISATIYDMFGFFHCSYLGALKKYGIGNTRSIGIIEDGKRDRGTFTYAEFDRVLKYWWEEISLFPPLADSLRSSFYAGGFRVSQWHGTGALATYALRNHNVKQLYPRPGNTPPEVMEAIRYAYAGGRFQPWQCGYHIGPKYTADINSAYMWACTQLPRMDNGWWEYQSTSDIKRNEIARFGVYRIKFDAGEDYNKAAKRRGIPERPYPLFHRDKNYRLTWPRRTEGWYWSPEARTVQNSSRAKFLEAWIFHDDGTYPFRWVGSYYDARLKLKKAGNPAERGYKGALASIYGKFAQRTGYDKRNGLPPKNHNLAWAGFITSWCRAAVFEAADSAYRAGGLIEIATDGVMSSKPFDTSSLVNGVGDGLGQWKLEEYAGLLYWQSGVYWLLEMDGEWKPPKARGIRRGKVPISVAMEALQRVQHPMDPVAFKIKKTMFIGYRQALNGQFDKWRRWVEVDDRRVMGGSAEGKCSHLFMYCVVCRNEVKGVQLDRMHTISQHEPDHWDSRPHPLPWLEPEDDLPENAFEIISNIFADEDISED